MIEVILLTACKRLDERPRKIYTAHKATCTHVYLESGEIPRSATTIGLDLSRNSVEAGFSLNFYFVHTKARFETSHFVFLLVSMATKIIDGVASHFLQSRFSVF